MFSINCIYAIESAGDGNDLQNATGQASHNLTLISSEQMSQGKYGSQVDRLQGILCHHHIDLLGGFQAKNNL